MMDWTSNSGLTDQQVALMRDYVAEREKEREHLVIHLSGAHAYGFPSPDSDLDLKAIHVAPTASLLGLQVPQPSCGEIRTIEGVEMDYTSNELGPVLASMLKGNGNYLERVLGTTAPLSSPLVEELRPLALASLSRRCAVHYRGFAEQQRQSLTRKPTVKRLLYVLRTLLTGLHALLARQIVPHLPTLAREHGVEGVDALVLRKQAGEQTQLDRQTSDQWGARVEALFTRLDEARDRSVLPRDPANEADVADWLLSVRRRRFD